MTTTMTLHAHVSTHSQDCDGPMYRDYVEVPNDDERAEYAVAEKRGYNNFADLTFQSRILAGHVSFSPLSVVEVSVSATGFNMREETDEGFRSSEVEWCLNGDCDTEKRSQRDVYAERMGY